MKDLTFLEQETLEILKQLEYCCDQFKILQKKKGVKSGVEVEIMADDIKTADASKKDFILVMVEKYLKEKGLDFSLTKEYVDYIKNDLTAEMYEGGDFNVIGIIKGEKIQEIKEKIKELINELSSKEIMGNASKKNTETGDGLEPVHPTNKSTFSEYIVKKGDDYYFREKIIHFGKGTQYKDLFDIIYSNCQQSSFIPYEDINKELLIKKWKPVPTKKINKRIQNTITNGIFRFGKIGDKKFKNILPTRKKILEIVRARGVIFNNR